MNWISVNNCLPDRNMSVIAYAPDGRNQTKRLVKEAYFMGSSFWFGYYWNRLDGVTHWMPLPEPPSVTKAPQDKKEGR